MLFVFQTELTNLIPHNDLMILSKSKSFTTTKHDSGCNDWVKTKTGRKQSNDTRYSVTETGREEQDFLYDACLLPSTSLLCVISIDKIRPD